jgi:SLT domain-containing protein
VVQTIPSTFAAFHQAGTSTNIYDPVANLCAARNYLLFDPKYRVAADGSDLGRIAQFNPRSAARGTEMSVEAFVRRPGV